MGYNEQKKTLLEEIARIEGEILKLELDEKSCDPILEFPSIKYQLSQKTKQVKLKKEELQGLEQDASRQFNLFK